MTNRDGETARRRPDIDARLDLFAEALLARARSMRS